MNEVFRYTGAVLILFSAVLLALFYKRYVERGIRERESFLSLIDCLRVRIDCYLSTLVEVFKDFKDEAIEPFLRRVREGESPESAFAGTHTLFAIGKGGIEILSRLFGMIGREYKAGVIASVDTARAAFTEYSAKQLEEGKKSVKLICALLLGGALGLVILLI